MRLFVMMAVILAVLLLLAALLLPFLLPLLLVAAAMSVISALRTRRVIRKSREAAEEMRRSSFRDLPQGDVFEAEYTEREGKGENV